MASERAPFAALATPESAFARPDRSCSEPSTALPSSSWIRVKPMSSRSAAVSLTWEATEARTSLMTVLPISVVM